MEEVRFTTAVLLLVMLWLLTTEAGVVLVSGWESNMLESRMDESSLMESSSNVSGKHKFTTISFSYILTS